MKPCCDHISEGETAGQKRKAGATNEREDKRQDKEQRNFTTIPRRYVGSGQPLDMRSGAVYLVGTNPFITGRHGMECFVGKCNDRRSPDKQSNDQTNR